MLSQPTECELQVLRAVKQHRSHAEAAEALTLSAHTVKRHLANMRKRYDCESTMHLLVMAEREGWLRKPAE